MERHVRLLRPRGSALIGVVLLVLALFEAGAAAPSADDAVRQAREAARADRHDDAIAAFDQALRAAPQRRPEWLIEYADQHTWRGRLDEAIVLYREALEHPDAASRQRARVGLARALSWRERHGEAVAEYELALAHDPQDRETRLGHARVQSWRGRHRDAAARMQDFLQTQPHDREATLVLAESWHWMGRTDRAIPLLREQSAADPGDRRAIALLGDLTQRLRPETTLDGRYFDQSDELRIDEFTLAHRRPLASGRGAFGPRYSLARYRPPRGPVSQIQVQRPGVEGRYRFSDALEWHGSLSVDLIDTRGAAGDHAPLTHDTYLTWWPSDLLRVDLASSRWTFDSEEALRSGLTATQLKLSADLLPDDKTRLSARTSRSRYADGNRRDGWQLEADRRVWRTPGVRVGLRHTGFDFLTPGQGGYYNPDRYRSNEFTLHGEGRLSGGLQWQLRWAAGREREQPGRSRAIRSGSASLGWELQSGVWLEAAYDHSTSRTLPGSGFARGIGRITLKYRH